MLKRLGIAVVAGMWALSVGVNTAQASVFVPPVVGSGGVGSSGIGPWPLIPIACSIVLPLLRSVALQRELQGNEALATTLICFSGPFGYAISTANGWIGPDFFGSPDS